MGANVGSFLAALTGGLTPQSQAANAQSRQQIQDLKSAQAAQALAGMFGIQPAAQPSAGMPAPGPRPPVPGALPTAPGSAPAAPPPPGMAAGAPAPAMPSAAPPPPSAGMGGPAPMPAPQGQPPATPQPQPQGQTQPGAGFNSPQAFSDVMQQTQGALTSISQKLAEQYRKAYGKDPDPATLLKATDLVIGQMKGLSPDVSAAMRLNVQQAKIDQMGQTLDEKAREFDANQQRLEAAQQENADLKMQIARLQATSRQGVADTNAGARVSSAKIGASARESAAATSAGARVQSANIGADARRDTAPDRTTGYALTQAKSDLTSADRQLASLRANGGSASDINAAQAERAAAKKKLDGLQVAPAGNGKVTMPKSNVIQSRKDSKGVTWYNDGDGKGWYRK